MHSLICWAVWRVRVCVCVHMWHALACLWRSEDTTRELALSFHSLGPWDPAQGIRLSIKSVCVLGHLSSPLVCPHSNSQCCWRGNVFNPVL